MLSGQPQSKPQQSAGYNGVVSVNGEDVVVQGGVAQYDGKTYYVSNDGDMVIDGSRNIIGYVDGGKFKPIDQAHLNMLREKKYLEE